MKAIQAVREGTNRFRAGKLFGIPRSTMFRLVDKYGRIKNNCFMAPVNPQMTSSGSFDQQHLDVGQSDSRDHQYVLSTNEHSSENLVKQEVRHYEDTPSVSSSGSVRLPTLSPEFSKISPEIRHHDQIPTVVK
ncbi:uncharacterized protein LOC123541781 [Mercenaria mercenaria]|uniref:uncharacterized protein LOC123541781 n=1 Tax=Mercenaria mercenaria TaxID=6596 RepID=UPI00234F0368|nr:uncharacterized protein LOC123541781 [Mercenaria mercenaria]